MKKFVNNIDNILTESLSGFGKAHTDIIKINHAPDFIARANNRANQKCH